MSFTFNPFTGNFDAIDFDDGPVSSVDDDGNSTMTVSPTTGDVLVAINLNNFNTWTNRVRFREDSDVGVEIGTNIDSGGSAVGYITSFGTASDIPFVIKGKGDGSFQLDEGGDARGANAIDFQKQRQNSTEVASGLRSFLLSGDENTVTGTNSGIVGGNNNTVDSPGSVIMAAAFSTDSSTFSGSNAIIGGTTHTISGAATALCGMFGGSTNTILAGSGNSIMGGQDNTISAGSFQTILGAFGSTISSIQVSAILSGSGNTITANSQLSTIVNGFACSTDAQISFIGNGSTCVINAGATASSIINGGNNTVSTGVFGATILNGFGSTAASAFQVLCNGIVAPYRPLEVVHHGGGFGDPVDGIMGMGGATAETTDATVTEMQINPNVAAATGIDLSVDQTLGIKGQIVARSAGGVDHARWDFDALIQDTGGVTALVGVPTVVMTQASVGAAAWAVAIVAGAAPNRLIINVTGIAATNIRWNCRYTYVEVGYP